MTTDAERLAEAATRDAKIATFLKELEAKITEYDEAKSSFTDGAVNQICRFANSVIDQRDAEIATLRLERDEARGEVERLRAQLNEARWELFQPLMDALEDK